MSGGSKKVTVGYWYKLLYHFGLVRGPVDAFLEFRGGDRVAWKGVLTESGRISINKPNLWGGEEAEGGLQGDLDVMFGEADQAPNDYLAAQLGADQPSYRGKLTAVWRGGRWGAINPYPKKAAMKVRRILKGWDGDAPWYPEKAVIGGGELQPMTWKDRQGYGLAPGFGPIWATAVAYSDGEWLAGWGNGEFTKSDNGENWSSQYDSPWEWRVNSVMRAAGVWVATGPIGNLATSTDRVDWTVRDIGFGSSDVKAVDYGAGIWVAVGSNGKLATSPNLVDWLLVDVGFGSSEISAVKYAQDRWVIAGAGGLMAVSVDLVTWLLVDSGFPSDASIGALGYRDGTWVAGGGNSLNSGTKISTSFDAENWEPVTVEGSVSKITSVACDGGMWLAGGALDWTMGGAFSRLFASYDARNWVDISLGGSFSLDTVVTDIATGGGLWIVALAVRDIEAVAGSQGWLLSASSSPAPLLAMNAAHILYDSLVARDMQCEPVGLVNDTSFRAAADRLYAERFGLCAVYEGGSIEDFQQRICDIIGGCLTQSIVDGQYYLDLIRGDYVLDDLPIITADDIVEFSQEPSILPEQPNQVSVEWFDPQEKSDRATAPLQALGAIQAAGGVIPETRTYREIPVEALALRVGARDLQALAAPTSRFRLTLNRRIFDLRPGRPFRLQYPPEGLGDIVCVLGDVDTGTLTDGRIRIVAVQDVYGFPDTVYVGEESGLAQPPATTPESSPHQLLLEAPFVELVGNLSRADLAALPSDIGMVMTAATRSTTGLNYAVHTAADGEDYAAGGNAEWCPTALINEVSSYIDTTFTLTAGIDLDDVQVGTWAQWDSEIVRVDALDVVAGTITLGRGCVDTVPVLHLASSRLFFCGDWAGTDEREYVEGDTVRAKLLTRTSTEELPLESAPELSTTIVGRQSRPYPPGQFKVNSLDYPTLIEGPLTVSWAHRDRLLQDDKLIDTGMGAIGPEPGTTYIARLLRAADETLLAETEVDGSSVVLSPTGEGNVILELLAVRGGIESWQRHRHPFLYTSTEFRVTEDGELRTEQDGNHRVLEAT